MKKLLIVILLVTSYSLFAGYRDIPVTRDLNPDAEYDTYQDWLESHPQQPTHVREISRMYSQQRDEGYLIVVNDNLYEDIEESILTYQQDLADEGHDTYIIEFDGTSHFDLKIQIMIYIQTENIANVVLVGDLPSAWFELFEDWNNNGIQDEDEGWAEFPCDLYFTDIDGTWEDTDENGVYDMHEGDKHPEITIGRIVAHNMSLLPDSEAELINDYFYKNHLFRTGIIIHHNTSLAYIDDDWETWGPEYQQAMQLAYPQVELVDDIEETTAGDYRNNRLTADYEFIQVHVHSGPEAHFFYYNNGNNHSLFNNYEIPGVNPSAHFYNLFCCSNSRFTTSNNMGGMYIYGDDHGMTTIGSTKTGSMLGFSDFYQPFGLGETLGESLRLWWENNVDTGPDWMWERAWFYGMIIQGDPSLVKEYEQGDVIYIPQNYPTIQEGIDAAENGFTIFVDDGTYNENLLIDGKEIVLQSTDGAESCIVDGGSNDTVLRIQNSENSVISGFTFQNGAASYGGGGINISGSSEIKECIIQNNSATRGGGIFVIGSPLIHDNIIRNNIVTVAGGGIISYEGEMNIYNNLFTQNQSDVYGGGIHIETSGIVEIFNNKISENTSQRGAAICFHAENAGGIVSNNLVINNTADFIHSDFGYLTGNHVLINNTFANNVVDSLGINFGQECNAILINNIIWENTDEEIKVNPDTNVEVRYCNVQGGWEGEGNIDETPRFMGQSYGDFSLTGFSPCIGAGIDEIELSNGTTCQASLFDLDGNPRPDPVGSNPDIGAYEHHNGEPYTGFTNEELQITNYELRNYPNPFNPTTTICFNLNTETTENAELIIYNLKGQKVKDLTPSLCHPELVEGRGGYSCIVTWNGTDGNNQPVSSGVYLYKLIIDEKVVANKKMLLLK